MTGAVSSAENVREASALVSCTRRASRMTGAVTLVREERACPDVTTPRAVGEAPFVPTHSRAVSLHSRNASSIARDCALVRYKIAN